MTQLKKGGSFLPMRLLNCAALNQPTVDSEGFSRGRSVAVTGGCWFFAFKLHFNGTSTALPENFQGKKKNNGICASIRIV